MRWQEGTWRWDCEGGFGEGPVRKSRVMLEKPLALPLRQLRVRRGQDPFMVI